MTSPVDLTLWAVNENDLVDAMVTALQVNIPEWIPQEGATEIMLMESLALVIGQQVYALNQLPRVVLDGVIAIRGYVRKPPVPAAGQVTVTIAATSLGTRTLPAGARFRVATESGGSVDMLTIEQVSLNPSDSVTGVVHVIADVPGTAPNGIAPGAVARMVDAYTWIESAVVSSIIGGGGNIETDIDFYSRVATSFQTTSTTLVIDAQFASAALGVPGVGRAKGFGLWDGVGAVGSMPGHVTVAVAGPDGSSVSAAVKALVLTTLTAAAVAGLQVHVIDFRLVTMSLTVLYSLSPGYADPVVGPLITAALRAWINPATWPLTESLTSVNQIILRIGAVAGVDNVISVAGWSSVTGGSTLPALSSVTVTAV